MIEAKLFHPTFSCPSPSCGASLHIAPSVFENYFYDKPNHCKWCNQPFEFWSVATGVLAQTPKLFRSLGASFVGAKQIFLDTQLSPNETIEVNLTNHGLSEQSRILFKNYNSRGNVDPVELHGNEAPISRNSKKLSIYGRPIPRGQSQPGQITIFVVFSEEASGNHALENLTLAFDCFIQNDLEGMIIPASTSMEYLIMKTASDFMKKEGLPALPENGGGLNKRHVVKIIIPLICKWKNLPFLKSHLEKFLNDLWRFRNEMAHKGHLQEPIFQSDASKMLCGVIFAFNYYSFLQRQFSL